jgi:hypothetical protein
VDEWQENYKKDSYLGVIYQNCSKGRIQRYFLRLIHKENGTTESIASSLSLVLNQFELKYSDITGFATDNARGMLALPRVLSSLFREKDPL